MTRDKPPKCAAQIALSITIAVFVLAGTFFVTQNACAENTAAESFGVSKSPPFAKSNAPLPPPHIFNASAVFRNAQFGTGGVALRNRSSGAINLSGVVSPVQAAYLYWAVIVTPTSPSSVQTIWLKRSWPNTSNFVALSGTLVGSGASPCWQNGTTNGTINVYRASVPANIANGNGTYLLVLPPGASGLTGGQNPWVAPVTFPLFEGASLVMVGAGTSTVALYNNGLAGWTFGTPSRPDLNYILVLPAAGGTGPVLLDNIEADGQGGTGRNSLLSVSGEVTTDVCCRPFISSAR